VSIHKKPPDLNVAVVSQAATCSGSLIAILSAGKKQRMRPSAVKI
jgi:hypothetical protein